MIVEPAPAKINLALHVTGQREDGYHLLDSLVAFADFGDALTIENSDRDSLSIVGPFARALGADQDTGHANSNSVVQARALLLDLLRDKGLSPLPTGTLALTLEKNLPVASGIGGGSADSAAALRGFNAAWSLDFDLSELQQMSQALGADLPMCIHCRAARVSGIGDVIEPLENFPTLPALLVNPGVEVSTPTIFTELETKTNPPLPPFGKAGLSLDGLVLYLEACRNDLEKPARRVAPVIDDVLTELRADPNCRLARMSGSGSTCFALFENIDQAQIASKRVNSSHPVWWAQACQIKDNPFAFGYNTKGP